MGVRRWKIMQLALQGWVLGKQCFQECGSVVRADIPFQQSSSCKPSAKPKVKYR